MTMRWEDERYVRIYTRDTVDWLGLSFLAQGLFCLLLRKVDRAGILPLGKHGKKSVAVAIGHGHQWGMLAEPLEELLHDGCVRIDEDHLLVPNFIEAQEAIQSDAARKRAQRERARASVTKCDGGGTTGGGPRDIESRNGTESHKTGTECHAVTDAVPSVTPAVTPSQPSRAVPYRAEPSQPANGQAGDEWLGSFRQKLAARLSLDAIDIGKDRKAVLDLFRSQLASVGEEQLLTECCDLAAKSTSGTPSSLAFFVKWLQRLPVSEARPQ
jgi:hypothetical protein